MRQAFPQLQNYEKLRRRVQLLYRVKRRIMPGTLPRYTDRGGDENLSWCLFGHVRELKKEKAPGQRKSRLDFYRRHPCCLSPKKSMSPNRRPQSTSSQPLFLNSRKRKLRILAYWAFMQLHKPHRPPQPLMPSSEILQPHPRVQSAFGFQKKTPPLKI